MPASGSAGSPASIRAGPEQARPCEAAVRTV